MIRINLLPVRVTKKQLQIRQQLALAVVVLVAAIGTVVYLDMKIESEISRYEQLTKDAERKLKQLDEQLKRIEDFKTQKAQLQEQLEVINKLIDDRKGPVRVMTELAASVPEKLWLNKMNIQAGKLSLEGVADAESTVIDFVQRLKEQKHVSNIEIQTFTAGKGEGAGSLREYVSFKLSGTVRLTS